MYHISTLAYVGETGEELATGRCRPPQFVTKIALGDSQIIGHMTHIGEPPNLGHMMLDGDGLE